MVPGVAGSNPVVCPITQFMDLIILAAIALFVVLRLKNQLGKFSDEDQQMITKKLEQQKLQALKQFKIKEKEDFLKANKRESSEKINSQYIKNLNSKDEENLRTILQQLNLDCDKFIDGAKSAFEMTLVAFAKGDKRTLKALLSEKIYEGFESAIMNRKNDKQKLNTEIISIDDVQITSSNLDNDKAFISVAINSKQINFITDEKNKVIKGSKEQINELKDIWTFKKDLSDNSPNWIVSTTG